MRAFLEHFEPEPGPVLGPEWAVVVAAAVVAYSLLSGGVLCCLFPSVCRLSPVEVSPKC